MRKAGCIQIDFGVERGSDKALMMVKKGITVKDIIKAFNYSRKLGIRTFASLIVNLPGEEEKDLSDIINLLEKIKPTITSINTFVPYPGTEIYDKYVSRFSIEDYAFLIKDPGMLVKNFPEKFKFCIHDVDIREWATTNTRKFNKVIPNLRIYLSNKYLLLLLRSRKKKDYFMQLGLLTKEFVIQKFGGI